MTFLIAAIFAAAALVGAAALYDAIQGGLRPTGRRRFRAAERCHATFGVPIDVDRPDSQISRTLAVR